MKSFHHHIISSWYFLRDGDLDAQLFPLRLAKTSILLRFPVIRPHSRNGIEQVVRVVFVLDLFQPRVVHAIVVALPVTIAEIRLIEVRASIRSQLSQLRRPSPYIGLDKINRVPNTPPASIINYPHVIAQVDRLHQSRVFDDDPKRYLSRTGTVSPQTREVRATQSVSLTVYIDLTLSDSL